MIVEIAGYDEFKKQETDILVLDTVERVVLSATVRQHCKVGLWVGGEVRLIQNYKRLFTSFLRGLLRRYVLATSSNDIP